jgi:hypothetical protein
MTRRRSNFRTAAARLSFLVFTGTLVGCGSGQSGGSAGLGGHAGTGAAAPGVGGTAGLSSGGIGGTGFGGAGLGGIVAVAGDGGSSAGGVDGGVAIGPGCVARTPGQWVPTSTVGEPPPMSVNGMVLWSGSALFVIGYDTTGGKYDPCLDRWQPFPANQGFTKRVLATSDGAYFVGPATLSAPKRFWFFDFATVAWSALSIEGYPEAADGAGYAGGTAAMVGGKLVRWAGEIQFAYPYPLLTNTGATYDPVTDRWQAMSTVGAPAERVVNNTFGLNDNYPVNNNYVATGSRLFVWGGARTIPVTSPVPKDDPTAAAMTKTPGVVCPSWDPQECSYGDGALYDPATDRWMPVSQSGAPSARHGHLTAWTGTRVLVWGGSRYIADSSGETSPEQLMDGALYDPATDAWTPTAAAPPGLKYTSQVTWSAGLMSVSYNSIPPQPTYTYNPATDTWGTAEPGPTMPARPDGPASPTIFWTGSSWIAYGGYRLGATPPNPCANLPPQTTGCDPPGPEHVPVSEAAVALPAP